MVWLEYSRTAELLLIQFLRIVNNRNFQGCVVIVKQKEVVELLAKHNLDVVAGQES